MWTVGHKFTTWILDRSSTPKNGPTRDLSMDAIPSRKLATRSAITVPRHRNIINYSIPRSLSFEETLHDSFRCYFFPPLPPCNIDRSSSLCFRNSVSDLQSHLSTLELRVARETRRRLSLEDEVRRLRDENRRLQDESHAAAQQLRRFTEWFFHTIDHQ